MDGVISPGVFDQSFDITHLNICRCSRHTDKPWSLSQSRQTHLEDCNKDGQRTGNPVFVSEAAPETTLKDDCALAVSLAEFLPTSHRKLFAKRS
jgi:hypothetical protein